MTKTKWHSIAEHMLMQADIKIDGNRPWDIQVHRPEFFERVFKYYSLGLGEAYMEGWWDCEQIDEFIFRVLNAKLDSTILSNKNFLFAILQLKLRSLNSGLFNQQSRRQSLEVGPKHYDIGNDLYRCMLDRNIRIIPVAIGEMPKRSMMLKLLKWH